jgi:hypothetical protein
MAATVERYYVTVIMLASSYLSRYYEKHGIGSGCGREREKVYEHLVVKRMGSGLGSKNILFR